MAKKGIQLRKLDINDPSLIKYTWELEIDSFSFGQQMKSLDKHIRKYTFADKPNKVQSNPSVGSGGLFGMTGRSSLFVWSGLVWFGHHQSAKELGYQH